MVFSGKKGQLTIFIIIGVVVLLLGFFIVYIRSSTSEIVDSKTLRRTPSSFEDYIEVCVNDVGHEAVRNLGFQGGFIYVPSYIKYDSDAFIALDARREFGIPSWYDRGQYRIPTIEDMEFEIARYVENNLDSCLESYETFTDTYDVIERGEKSAYARIGYEDVLVQLNYPIDVKTKDSEQTQSYTEFQSALPVPLGQMHELGQQITYSSVYNGFFEESLIDLISADPSIPITGVEFDCGGYKTTWRVSDIENSLTGLLTYNLPNVRFTGTDYQDFDGDVEEYENVRGMTLLDLREGKIPANIPEDSYDYFHFFYDINILPEQYEGASGRSFNDIKAGVKFNEKYPLTVNVRPSSRGLMRANVAKFPGTEINFICMKQYHFVYDIDALVEIDMYSEKAFSGDGYLFRFALPINIRSNQVDKTSSEIINYNIPRFYDEPCNNLVGEVDIRAYGSFMGYDDIELDGADVSFDCVKFGCDLGTTSADAGIYRLRTGLPSTCTNGFVNVRKEGYLDTQVQYTGGDILSVNMKKIKDLELVVDKRLRYSLGASEALEDGESIIVQMTPYGVGEDNMVMIDSENPVVNVTLLEDSGKYYIDALLVDQENSRIIGGYRGNFTYTINDISGKNKLYLSVVDYTPIPLPFDGEAQTEIINYIDGDSYQDSIYPSFI